MIPKEGQGGDLNPNSGEVTAEMMAAGIDVFAAYYPDASADGDAEAFIKAILAAILKLR